MKMKVLVVDDESDFVELISFNLERCGYQVLKAHTGEEGLELARDARPDLIVLDVMMPGIDGFSVCEILRREIPTIKAPIIFYSALSGEIARLNGMEAGADDYLSKSCRIQEFLERVRVALARQISSQSPAPTQPMVGKVPKLVSSRPSSDPGRAGCRADRGLL